MREDLSREVTDLAKAQFFLLLASSQPCNFQIPLSLSDFSPLFRPRSFTLCFFSGFFRAETRTGKRPGFFLMRQWRRLPSMQTRTDRRLDFWTLGQGTHEEANLFTFSNLYLKLVLRSLIVIDFSYRWLVILTIKWSMYIDFCQHMPGTFLAKVWAVPPKSKMKHQRIFTWEIFTC